MLRQRFCFLLALLFCASFAFAQATKRHSIGTMLNDSGGVVTIYADGGGRIESLDGSSIEWSMAATPGGHAFVTSWTSAGGTQHEVRTEVPEGPLWQTQLAALIAQHQQTVNALQTIYPQVAAMFAGGASIDMFVAPGGHAFVTSWTSTTGTKHEVRTEIPEGPLTELQLTALVEQHRRLVTALQTVYPQQATTSCAEAQHELRLVA